MTKENSENFKNSSKCCICDNGYIDNDIKARSSAHGDGNINLRLNLKITVVFHNLNKTYPITRHIDLKINILANGLEKYMSFTINNNDKEYECVLSVWNKFEIKK